VFIAAPFYFRLVRLNDYEFANNITRAGQISILHFDYTKQLDMKLNKIKVYIIYIIRLWDGERIGGLLLTIKIN